MTLCMLVKEFIIERIELLEASSEEFDFLDFEFLVVLDEEGDASGY